MGEAVRPWPRLLSEAAAADYLSLSATTIRGLDLKVRRVGKRKLYDIRDLDGWVDRMDDAPIPAAERERAARDEEERFFARWGGNARP